MQTFYSHGKLLITGEYAILDGALGLALPTQKGQSMTIEQINEPKIIWKSIDCNGNTWFEDEFLINDIIATSKQSENSKDISSTLIEILKTVKQLNPSFFNQGYKVVTTLEFPQDWGLGSSSTLINNIANWAHVDAFELLEKTFGGSGYDIACAKYPNPITYQLKNEGRLIKSIAFNPNFLNHLYFVHQNKKQNSREGINHYKTNRNNLEQAISKISAISKLIINCDALVNFEGLLQRHENIISELINLPTLKDKLFSDYDGAIKSLGAWGGDFILATAKEDPTNYFKKKNFKTVIPFHKMILKQKDLT